MLALVGFAGSTGGCTRYMGDGFFIPASFSLALHNGRIFSARGGNSDTDKKYYSPAYVMPTCRGIGSPNVLRHS